MSRIRNEGLRMYLVFHILKQTPDCGGMIGGPRAISDNLHPPRAARWITCLGLYFSYNRRVCAGSLQANHRTSVSMRVQWRLGDAPKIPLRRARKDPSFTRSLAKPRSFRFCVDNMFDGLADKASSTSNKDDVGHPIDVNRSMIKSLSQNPGPTHFSTLQPMESG